MKWESATKPDSLPLEKSFGERTARHQAAGTVSQSSPEGQKCSDGLTSAIERLPSRRLVNCACRVNKDYPPCIQCTVCLCWQHSRCVGARAHGSDEKHVCFVCADPPGVRESARYVHEQDWLIDGRMARFSCAAQEPHEPGMARIMRGTHELIADLHGVRRACAAVDRNLAVLRDRVEPELSLWGSMTITRCKSANGKRALSADARSDGESKHAVISATDNSLVSSSLATPASCNQTLTSDKLIPTLSSDDTKPMDCSSVNLTGQKPTEGDQIASTVEISPKSADHMGNSGCADKQFAASSTDSTSRVGPGSISDDLAKDSSDKESPSCSPLGSALAGVVSESGSLFKEVTEDGPCKNAQVREGTDNVSARRDEILVMEGEILGSAVEIAGKIAEDSSCNKSNGATLAVGGHKLAVVNDRASDEECRANRNADDVGTANQMGGVPISGADKTSQNKIEATISKGEKLANDNKPMFKHEEIPSRNAVDDEDIKAVDIGEADMKNLATSSSADSTLGKSTKEEMEVDVEIKLEEKREEKEILKKVEKEEGEEVEEDNEESGWKWKMSAAELSLLEHITSTQDLIESRLDLIEEQVTALESGEGGGGGTEEDVLSDVPRVLKSLRHLLGDLASVKQMTC